LKTTLELIVLSLMILSVTACSREPQPREVKTASASGAREGGRPAMTQPAPGAAGASGTVVETMNAAGYTYVQVDTGSERIWAAAPEIQVKVGDQVVIPQGMPMRNYHSKTLNRDFAVVYFVGSILDKTGGTLVKGTGMPPGHPPTATSSTPPPIDLTGVKKADGGVTVGELYAKKAALSGKEIALRGKVVKFNAQIMDKNWLHVRDGSGDGDGRTNDLTVTTDATVKVGDTVLIRGKVILDKDFGAGYKYDVIVEDAKVTRE
jgi:hypothetical protein